MAVRFGGVRGTDEHAARNDQSTCLEALQAMLDLNLLVDPLRGATLFDLGGLHADLEALLGVRVDLLTPADLPPELRRKILTEAWPV